ncbi:family 1 glycosylhydrolase [Actinomadura sp. SCN-SB]|uniref:family 1 glycosylhydrolase n=1 Tax=Actinomadura sp. SCN-SB TaxID=3373092 RepID=UPI003750C847
MVSSEGPADLRHVDWGIAVPGGLAGRERAGRGATPSRGQAGRAVSPRARRWARDIEEIVGVTPHSRRVTIGWRHLQPDGPASWNRAAVDRCDRTLDAWLSAGLRPNLSLVYLDLPGWLDDAGGWLRRETALRFADFAAEMGRRFGDRVDRWFTFRNLMTPSLADRVAGMAPPGRGAGLAGLPAVHHVLLGHGLAMRALRSAGVDGEVGCGTALIAAYAATGDPYDGLAAERLESWSTRLFLDPLLYGEYLVPESGVPFMETLGCVRPGDLETIAQPQDFLGLIWSGPMRATAPENLPRVLPALGCFEAMNQVNRLLVRLGFAVVPFEDVPTTSYGWPVIPEALADALAAVKRIYGDRLPPVHLTDSGIGDLDAGESGRAGARRRQVRSACLGWLHAIMAEGADVRGYEYAPVIEDLDWKLRYTRLYGLAVPDTHPVRLPRPPHDWVATGVFDPPPPAGPGAATPQRDGTIRLLRTR